MKFLSIVLLIVPFLVFGQQNIKKENLTKPEFSYWDFSKKRIQSVGSFYKDQLGETKDKHGVWKFYDKFGILEEERNYQKGKLDGKVMQYFPNGKPRQEGYFKLNKQDSIYREWNETGLLAIEGRFELDIPKGIWKYFYIDGREKSHEERVDSVTYIRSFWLPDPNHTQTIIDGNGEMQTFHTTGTIKENYTYKNGLPNGPFQEKSIYGYDLLSGNFKDGEKDGEWKYYYYTGDLEKISHYKNDLLDGKYEYFYDSGKLNVTGQYKENKKDSIWTWYTNKGTTDMKGNFVKDLQDGKWEYWYPTGEKSYEAYFTKGLKSGDWTYWYKDGSVFKKCKYAEDLKEGQWKTWYENGTLLMDGKYVADKEEGEWLNYWEDGKLKNSAFFKKGELNGAWKSYFPDGTPKLIGAYKNNFKNGTWTEYFSNGNPKDVISYKVVEKETKMNYGVMKGHKVLQSIEHGKAISYSDKDFKKTEEGTYKNGEKHGTWTAYYPGGSYPAVVNNYKNGLQDGKMLQYTRRGELTTEINYSKGEKHGDMIIYGANKKIISKKKFYYGVEMK